jgi:hypothetical protein
MITTEEAERLASWCDFDGFRQRATAIRSLAAERDALRDENARLREALDFYACVDHYQIHNAAAPNVVQFDRGAKARAALGETQ